MTPSRQMCVCRICTHRTSPRPMRRGRPRAGTRAISLSPRRSPQPNLGPGSCCRQTGCRSSAATQKLDGTPGGRCPGLLRSSSGGRRSMISISGFTRDSTNVIWTMMSAARWGKAWDKRAPSSVFIICCLRAARQNTEGRPCRRSMNPEIRQSLRSIEPG